MNERRSRRARGSLVVSLAAACFVIAGALALPASAKDAKAPGARRGRRKAPAGQAATGRKKPGAGGTVRLARLNEKMLRELYAKLDTDNDGKVSMTEFKALPAVIEKVLKAAAKGRGGRNRPAGGAKKGGRKGGGRRKKAPNK